MHRAPLPSDTQQEEQNNQENAFTNRNGPSQPPPFTKEERQLFEECKRRSFFERSVPLSILFGGLAVIGTRRGFIKPSARFGALPSIFFGITTGYLMGKFSYVGTCRELFLKKLPNSNISQVIRKSQGMAPLAEEPQSPVDDHSVVFADEGSEGEAPAAAKKRISYDDLREQRRKGQAIVAPPPSTYRQSYGVGPPPSLMPADEDVPAPGPPGTRTKRSNKYGDEGFE